MENKHNEGITQPQQSVYHRCESEHSLKPAFEVGEKIRLSEELQRKLLEHGKYWWANYIGRDGYSSIQLRVDKKYLLNGTIYYDMGVLISDEKRVSTEYAVPDKIFH